MKRIVPVIIVIASALLLIAGCSFNSSDNRESTTIATETTTTVQGNSKMVTLAQETTVKTAKNKPVYYSQNMDASFNIPLKWENKYAVEDSVSQDGSKHLSFFDKINHSNNGKGLVFTYNLFITDDYKKGTGYTEYGTVTSDNITYYIVCTLPDKRQYPKKSNGLKKAYEELNQEKYITYICNSAKFAPGATLDKTGCSTTPSSTLSTDSTEESSNSGDTKPRSNTANTTVNGLVFSDISVRKLTDSEVKALGSDKVQQAINDICAIHGYNFKTQSIKEHYQQFSWYKPRSNFSESNFNSIEKYNYDLLQKYR